MKADLSDFTLLCKHLEFSEAPQFSLQIEAMKEWLKSVGMVEILPVPAIRCSSSEPITFAARFSWRVGWLRITLWGCWSSGKGSAQVSIHTWRPYESPEHMMRRDARQFIEAERHKLDRLNPVYFDLLPADLQRQMQKEPCCKDEHGVFRGGKNNA